MGAANKQCGLGTVRQREGGDLLQICLLDPSSALGGRQKPRERAAEPTENRWRDDAQTHKRKRTHMDSGTKRYNRIRHAKTNTQMTHRDRNDIKSI